MVLYKFVLNKTSINKNSHLILSGIISSCSVTIMRAITSQPVLSNSNIVHRILMYIIPPRSKTDVLQGFSNAVGFVLGSQSGIPGANSGQDRNSWAHFPSPNAPVHLASTK